MKPKFDVGSIFRDHWQWILNSKRFSSHQLRMLKAIAMCRTEALGGHLEECGNCRFSQIVYKSCRNRNCPKCQTRQRQQWIENREQELLPVPYFHVVFTVPDSLNSLFRHMPAIMPGILFKAAWQTIKLFAKDPKFIGAKTGMTAILHTWGQNMSLHPHLHCIVPGGGLTNSGVWKNAKYNGKFLFPVKAMSKVFRAKFVAILRKEAKKNKFSIPDKTFKALFAKKWVVFAKRPFLGPKQVLEYLGRYTHKIAISNYRICNVTSTHVEFYYKDYRQGGKKSTMNLPVREFIRRFAMHILPHAFIRIRHFGFLANRFKKQRLLLARISIGDYIPQPATIQQIQVPVFEPGCCPKCKEKTMVCIRVIPKNKEPPFFNRVLQLRFFPNSRI